MKRRLSQELTLYFNGLYPRRFKKRPKGVVAILGLGGNIANVPRRFAKVALLLASHPRIKLIATAPILKNPPFGYLDQPYFFNSAMAVQTQLSPQELLRFVLRLERRFKRVRTFKNAPRTLDIDIIFFGERIVQTKELTLPHPFWSKRESVIIPVRFLLERL